MKVSRQYFKTIAPDAPIIGDHYEKLDDQQLVEVAGAIIAALIGIKGDGARKDRHRLDLYQELNKVSTEAAARGIAAR